MDVESSGTLAKQNVEKRKGSNKMPVNEIGNIGRAGLFGGEHNEFTYAHLK